MFASTLAIGAALWGVHALAKLPWYGDTEAAWLLDVARHVVMDKGTTTSVTLPVYLVATGDAPVDADPYLRTPPGYPLLLGLVLRVFGPSEASAMLLHGVLFVALLALTFTASRALLPPRWAAVATLMLALDPALLLSATFIAEHNLPFWVGIMGVLALLLRASGLWAVLFAGTTLGLLQIVRFNAVWYLPAFLVLLWLVTERSQRARRGATFAGAWLVATVAAAMLTRGTATSISAVTSILFGTSAFPGLTIQGVLSLPTLSEVFTTYLPEIAAKYAAGLRFYVMGFGVAGAPALAGGAIVAFVLLLRSRSEAPLAWWAAVATVTTVALMSFFDFALNHLTLVLPAYAILVLAALRRAGVDLRVAAAVLLALSSLQYAAETAKSFRDMPSRAAYAAEMSRLWVRVSRYASPSDWIATDVPSVLTWHTGVPSIRLPNSPADLSAVERLRRPLTLLVVTDIETPDASTKFPPGAWGPVVEGRPVPGFELAERFEGQRIRAVILRRSP